MTEADLGFVVPAHGQIDRREQRAVKKLTLWLLSVQDIEDWSAYAHCLPSPQQKRDMTVQADLLALGILDGPEEPEFDSLTRLARKMLGSRVALFTIIDGPNQRQFFKSSNGVTEDWAEKRETPLTHSISKFVKEDGQPIRIADTRLEPRLAGANTPSEHNAIAYLGVPISDANNEVIGALCVIDSAPRIWTDDELDDLLVIGGAISNQIQLRMALKQAEIAKEAAETAAELMVVKDRKFSDLARNLPGAMYRYILRPNGQDEIEYMSPGCLEIWEFSDAAMTQDPGPVQILVRS